MIAERPGGVNPSEPSKNTPDTKAQREEKQKVEKVREIDADEEAQRRKRKFQMMMGDEEQVESGPRAPSPFETEFYNVPDSSGPPPGTTMQTTAPSSSMGDLEDDAVPSPNYSPPPNVNATPPPQAEDETEDDLPQSEKFWNDADLPPDQPLQPQTFKETNRSIARGEEESSKKTSAKGKFGAPEKPIPGKAVPKEASPFGLPGKASGKPEKPKEEKPFFAPQPPAGKREERKGRVPKKEELPTARYLSREEENIPKEQRIVPIKKEEGPEKKERPRTSEETKRSEKKPVKQFEKEQEPGIVPLVQERREDREEKRGKGSSKIEEISLPHQFSPSVQPMAEAAAQQATPYLNPATVPLFFMMVGTMYVMIAPPGVSRTEIVLNNPAFANSKFFGTTITLEKYTTAPDSFNIRLTGSDAAVTAFRENIPTLMASFQNSNLPFRINRLDAEYSIERPVFRRREREEKKDFGGDLGDRRK